MTKSLKIILFLFFIFSTSTFYGQSYVGAFIGLNSSKLVGDPPKNSYYKSLLGANAGVIVDIKIARIIWLSVQPSYSQEGTKIFYNVKSYEEPIDSIHIRLNYFSIPLLLKVSTTNGRFYAIGGFEFALLLNSEMSGNDVKEDITARIADGNIAMHFGAGINIPIGFPRLFVELRYTQGLINLTDEPAESGFIPRVKTAGFKLLAGIEIPLKRKNK
jgi:hypothetical protein